jgi:hypothetical protein
VAGICECGNEPWGFIKCGFECHLVVGKSVVLGIPAPSVVKQSKKEKL